MITAFIGLIGLLIGYGLKLFEIKWNKKLALQLSLIDKKMEVSQEAFTLSLELGKVIHAKLDIQMKVIENSQNWFNKNCLYLNSKIRHKFLTVINEVFDYEDELENYHQVVRNSEDKDLIETERKNLKSKFKKIMRLPKEIADSIDKQYNY